MSAATYEGIQQSCYDRQWIKAKALVPDLKMDRLIPENRQYVKYSLLALAVFGAGMAKEDSHTFLTQGDHEQVLDQVVAQMQVYFSNRATQEVQVQALQLIAQAQMPFPVKKVQKGEFKYKYGSTQVAIQGESAVAVELNRLRDLIDDADLAGNGKDIGGNHVTIRYGVTGERGPIEEYFQQQPPFMMVLGKITVFEPSNSSDGQCPVVVDVLSHDLTRMHYELEKTGQFKPDDFVYHAHATLAYVKPEAADKYRMMQVHGQQYWCQFVQITDRMGQSDDVWLLGEEAIKDDMTSAALDVAGRLNPQQAEAEPDEEEEKRKKVRKDADTQEEAQRFLRPFVSFAGQGDEQIQLAASLNGSRIAAWGFVAEAEMRDIRQYKRVEIMDARCCDFCRMMNNREFEVKDAKRTIIEQLSVQNPEDLRNIAPFVKTDKASMDAYADMDQDEMVARGFHVPPSHPGCRGLLSSTAMEVRVTRPVVAQQNQVVPSQITAAEAFKELGVSVDQKQLDHWNSYMGVSPVQLIAKMLGADPNYVMEGPWSPAVRFMQNGDFALGAKANELKSQIGATYDPYSGRFYLDKAQIGGDEEAQKAFMGKVYQGMIEAGQSIGASAIVLNVTEDALVFLQMGFAPSPLDWQKFRQEAIDRLKTGDLAEQFAALDASAQKDILDLLGSNNESEAVRLAKMADSQPLVGELLADLKGKFSLDLSDEQAVANAKDYLQND